MMKVQRILLSLTTFFATGTVAIAEPVTKCAEHTGTLFAAYVGVWILTLILVIRIGLKASNIDKELKQAQHELNDLESRMDTKKARKDK